MRQLAVVVLFISRAALAQPVRTLTLDDALQLAREHSRDLAAAHTRIAQSASYVTQAWAALLPTSALQGKYTHNYKEVSLNLADQNQAFFALIDIIKATSGNPIQNGALNQFELAAAQASATPLVLQKAEQLDFVVSVALPLVVPWAYPALKVAKKNLQVARANYGVAEAQILLNVATAFFAVAGAEGLVTARKHAIEVAKQTVDNAQARLEAGVVNRVDVTRAELALLRAEQAARETDDLREQTYRALATLIVLNEPYQVVTGGDPPEPRESPSELVDDALKLRPEFAAFAHTDEALAAQASSSRWRWAPTLSGFGNLRAFNYAGFAGDNYAWAVGLQLDWIIYDGGVRDAARQLALAQKQENDLHWMQLKATVADDVLVARRAIGTKRAALATARRSVELSKEALALVRVQHNAGTATQLDLLQAQDSLVASEVAQAQARFDLELSTLQLKQKAGLFPASDK